MRRRTFIQTIMIGTGSVVIGSSLANTKKDAAIRVRMIYNNIGLGAELSSKWGLSMLIESSEETVLFDTGGEPEVLWSNMQKLGIDIDSISKVIISHNHWDHVNGLPTIIDRTGTHPTVYVPQNEKNSIEGKFPGLKYLGVNKPLKINNHVWTTGQLTGSYKETPIYEQSIIITYAEDVFVFTGCSHPGIVNIVDKARKIFPEKNIKFVAGGFHLNRHSTEQIHNISNQLKELKVEKIGPSHCTGDQAMKIFKQEWENKFVDFNLKQNQVVV